MTCGAPGPVEVGLSLVVHRCFPLCPRAIAVGLDWLGLTDPAAAPYGPGVVAARQGVSRQRAQAVVAELRGCSAVLPPPPALVQAVALIANGPPAQPAGDVADSLLAAGLATGPLHPAVLLRAAGLFAVPAGFAVRGRSAVAVTGDGVSGYDRLPASARSAAGRRGVVRLADISAGFPGSVVRAALAGHPALVVHGDWYWQSPDRGQLARIVGRLLTVCGPLPLEEVRAGVARATRHRPTSIADIPTDVLAAYLASQPAYRRAGKRIGLHEADGGLLTGTDRALVGAFTRSATGEVTTGELVSALTEAGLAASGAHSLVAFSPLLRQVRLGVQRLRSGRDR